MIAHADEITGKGGDSLRAHLADVMRNRRLNAWSATSTCGRAPADLARRPWDRRRCTTLFDGLEFRVLRDRLFETLEDEEVDEAGFDLAGTGLGPASRRAWLAGRGTAPGRRRVR